MRLSLVFELLLIFVLLAFAASRVIDSKGVRTKAAIRKPTKVNKNHRQDANRYCSCSTKLCNCCREFNIPLVAFQGPGCATLQYLQGDRLAISMSFGERVLTNTTISGRKPKPVCMPLPGGVSKFCGRVYNIGRQGEDFKACLGLELRALQDLEASLRVSCFRFGPKGLKVEAAQPLPVVAEEGNKDDYDDEDDDDDDYDFDDDEYDVENDVDSVDYSDFGVFDDDFVGDLFGEDSGSDDVAPPVKNPVKKGTPTRAPARRTTRKPLRTSTKAVRKPSSPKPVSSKATARVTKGTSTTTTSPTVMVPVVTVAPIKEPEMSNEQMSAGNVASSPHESIAAVTAMLQESPTSISHMEPVEAMPTKMANAELGVTASPTNVTFSENTVTSIIQTITERLSDSMITATTMQESLDTETESSTLETVDSTETYTTEDEGESNTERVESLILKNKDDDDEDDDEDDDDDADEDNDDDDDADELTGPISSVVEEVLGEEDDDVGQKNKTKKSTSKKYIKKSNKTKKDSQGMLDDIVDGVVESITGEDVELSLNPSSNVNFLKGHNASDDDEDDDDDNAADDTDDDDDDEDDDGDDEEDDDDDSDKKKNRHKEDSD